MSSSLSHHHGCYNALQKDWTSQARLLTKRQLLTGEMFMWTAPHPAWNQTTTGGNSAKIHTAVLRVLNGSANFNLRWRYRLGHTQNITLTTFNIDAGSPSKIGVVAGGVPTVLIQNDYKNRFEVQSNAEFSSLAIKLVTERENATFQCKVLLTDGNEWAYNVRIEVTVPPNIIHISNNKTVSKSDEVSLVCEVDGYPIPTITWTKLPKNKVITMPLMITGENDGGTYRCTADNGVGNPSFKDVFIAVSSPPEITKPSKRTWEVTTGESVNIECHASGSPRPQYVWRKAGGRVVVDGKLLHFQDVNKSHEGNYTCTAWNRLASANLTILINVQRTSTPKNIRSITTMVFVTGKEEEKTATDNTVKYILIGIGSVGFPAAVIALAMWCRRMNSRRGRFEINQKEAGIKGSRSCIHQWIRQRNPKGNPSQAGAIILT